MVTRIEECLPTLWTPRAVDLLAFGVHRVIERLSEVSEDAQEVTNEGAGVGSLLPGEPLTYRVMTRDEIEDTVPEAVDLYLNLTTALVRQLYSDELYPLPGSRGINLNRLPEGAGMEWHQDGADVALTSSVAVQPGGGALAYFDPAEVDVQRVDPAVGQLTFLPGRYLHRVDPGDVDRVTLIQAWTTDEHRTMVEKDGRESYLYG